MTGVQTCALPILDVLIGIWTDVLDLSRFCIRYSSLILKELFIIDFSVSLHASETVNRVKRANRLVMNLFIVIFLLY